MAREVARRCGVSPSTAVAERSSVKSVASLSSGSSTRSWVHVD